MKEILKTSIPYESVTTPDMND